MESKDNLYKCCKDQRYPKDENDVSHDDFQELDLDYNECDFDFECNNSDDSNFEG